VAIQWVILFISCWSWPLSSCLLGSFRGGDPFSKERLVAKIRKISGVKFVNSLLNSEEKKHVVSGSTLITELTAAKIPAV
jgi:hypothetical protein